MHKIPPKVHTQNYINPLYKLKSFVFMIYFNIIRNLSLDFYLPCYMSVAFFLA
jgi:hypothetical protein